MQLQNIVHLAIVHFIMKNIIVLLFTILLLLAASYPTSATTERRKTIVKQTRQFKQKRKQAHPKKSKKSRKGKIKKQSMKLKSRNQHFPSMESTISSYANEKNYERYYTSDVGIVFHKDGRPIEIITSSNHEQKNQPDRTWTADASITYTSRNQNPELEIITKDDDRHFDTTNHSPYSHTDAKNNKSHKSKSYKSKSHKLSGRNNHSSKSCKSKSCKSHKYTSSKSPRRFFTIFDRRGVH